VFVVTVILQKSHLTVFTSNFRCVSALLLDDASKPVTPLTNVATSQTLWHFAPLSDNSLFSLLTVVNRQHW